MTPPALHELIERLRYRRSAAPPESWIVGRRIEYHASIDSTNDRARDLAASGEPEGTVVVADEQTSGRGRGGRSWHSPPGLGVYLSAILRPTAPPSSASICGLLAAVAGASALGRLSPEPVRIKWPNDLVVDGRFHRWKLGGILTEARTSIDQIRDVVVGIGVNVNQLSSDFPPGLTDRATSLRVLSGTIADRCLVAVEIVAELDEWYTLWAREGDRPVIDAFRTRALDLEGRRVRVSGYPGGPDESVAWLGTTAGLSDDGALRVKPERGGDIAEVRYGEVGKVEEA